MQHQAFLPSDQPDCQSSFKPASQLYKSDTEVEVLVVGQPLAFFTQHHPFLAKLQPVPQFANPALQSYGSDDGQPRPPCSQHHRFLLSDQPVCQCKYPILHSKDPLQPRPTWAQHHDFFESVHPRCQLLNPALQSNGGDVVLQPRLTITQQNCRFFCDHSVSHLLNPASQSYAIDVVGRRDVQPTLAPWAQHQFFLPIDHPRFHSPAPSVQS